jgi:hypothetical protein
MKICQPVRVRNVGCAGTLCRRALGDNDAAGALLNGEGGWMHEDAMLPVRLGTREFNLGR